MKILVSGVAGDIGFGVGRILKKWGIFDKLIGIDVSDDHPAKIIFDQVDVAPVADESFYLEWLCNFISKNSIDLFIPTSEAEILVISNNLDKIQKYTKILINDKLIVNKCLDKWQTLKFLYINGVAVPDNGLVGQDTPSSYPVIVKARRGRGGKGLQKIDTKSQFQNCANNLVWQEFLEPADQEYTCAVYISKNFNIRTLLIKRLLIAGYTGKGVVVKNEKINDYVKKIVKTFNKPGCYNIQLNLTVDGPRVFEINPRLSSTIVFRDKLGFNDLRWWVSELLNIKYSLYKRDIDEGTKIYRGNTEYIISSNSTKKYNDNNIGKNQLDEKPSIHLEKIIPTSDQLQLLYLQLEKRSHNISHNAKPSFEEHQNFVKNNPYRVWFIVKNNNKPIGNIYIQSDNSVGLNLEENITSDQIQTILSLIGKNFPPLKSIPSSRRGNYFVNVPSSNIDLQNKLTLIKCSEIQRTYVWPEYLNEKEEIKKNV